MNSYHPPSIELTFPKLYQKRSCIRPPDRGRPYCIAPLDEMRPWGSDHLYVPYVHYCAKQVLFMVLLPERQATEDFPGRYDIHQSSKEQWFVNCRGPRTCAGADRGKDYPVYYWNPILLENLRITLPAPATLPPKFSSARWSVSRNPFTQEFWQPNSDPLPAPVQDPNRPRINKYLAAKLAKEAKRRRAAQ
jgi:hypothetical protein